MNYQELNSLTKSNIDDLYNLNTSTFEYLKDVIGQYPELKYRVTSSREMRMDLICNDIYNNTDYVDILMLINNIRNPLIISQGTFIQYVPEQIIPLFRPSISDTDTVRAEVSISNRQSRKDPNRQEFLRGEENSLPTTMTSRDYNPVKYNSGTVTIGEGIFDN